MEKFAMEKLAAELLYEEALEKLAEAMELMELAEELEGEEDYLDDLDLYDDIDLEDLIEDYDVDYTDILDLLE